MNYSNKRLEQKTELFEIFKKQPAKAKKILLYEEAFSKKSSRRLMKINAARMLKYDNIKNLKLSAAEIRDVAYKFFNEKTNLNSTRPALTVLTKLRR